MSQHIGNRLPAPLRFDLGAAAPAGAVASALLLATVDEDGSPRLAVLAAGEVAVLDEARVSIDAHEASKTCENLLARPRAALWCVLDAAAYTIKGVVTPDAALAVSGRRRFVVDVNSVWRDFEPAAPMIAGPTYRAGGEH